MKIKGIFLIGLIFIGLFLVYNVKAVSSNLEESFDNSIEDWMNRYDIPGVGVSIIEEGEVVYSNTLGYANVEKEVLLTTDTILRTESISKTITAYLTMILVEQGIFSLDDRVQDYIDIWVPEELTIHMLLTHQSGLDIGPFSLHFSPDEAMPSLREHLIDTIDFINDPGTTFSYSNVGYNLMQYVIETIMNQPFNNVVKQYIFEPSSITDASFEYDHDLKDLYALGYDINNNPVEPYVYPDKAAGGLFTDLEALTTLIQQILVNDIVLSQSQKEMMYDSYIQATGEYSIVSDGYGYGHFISLGEDKAVFHGGQGHGWMAFYYAYPEDQSAIIIITNSQRSYPMISGLIDLFAQELGYEQSKMAVISNALVFMTVFVIVVAICCFLWITKMYLKLYKHYYLSLKKNIIYTLILLVLVFVVMYLWLTPYMFIQVLYPKHYEATRLILSFLVVLAIPLQILDIFKRNSV